MSEQHKLQRVSATRSTGDPHSDVFAVCVCGFKTSVSTQRAVGIMFDDHLQTHDVDPLAVRVPWRENA